MSYAWHQLQCAVKALNSARSRREGLANAYSRLLKLKRKDLPAEVADDFSKLVGGIPRYPIKSVYREVKAKVAVLTDAELAQAISLISGMHDALAVYQPRRSRPAALVPLTLAQWAGEPVLQAG